MIKNSAPATSGSSNRQQALHRGWPHLPTASLRGRIRAATTTSRNVFKLEIFEPDMRNAHTDHGVDFTRDASVIRPFTRSKA